jgi:hypothetical protein
MSIVTELTLPFSSPSCRGCPREPHCRPPAPPTYGLLARIALPPTVRPRVPHRPLSHPRSPSLWSGTASSDSKVLTTYEEHDNGTGG